MITPDDIREKARRQFAKSITAWLAGEPFFPYRLAADLKLPNDFAVAIQSVEELRSQSKAAVGHGYRIEWQERRSRTHGRNEFPIAIYFDSLDDLSRLIGKSAIWKQLKSQTGLLRDRLPGLEAWLRQSGHWRKLIEVGDDLNAVIGLTEYLITHPRPNVFARQIPVASSKLLEQNKPLVADWLERLLPPSAIDVRYAIDQFEPRYGLKYGRPHFLVRPLDREWGRHIGLPFEECSLPAQTLGSLSIGDGHVFIVENKVNVLTMPAAERSLVLGGLGNAVTQLCDIPWLRDRPVHYWGDLDAPGFEILGRLRDQLPDVRSRLMDEATLNQCQSIATLVRPTEPKPSLNLTTAEQAAYESICEGGLRIEQEHLSDALVRQWIAGITCLMN